MHIFYPLSLSISAQFYRYLKLFKGTRKEKKSKKGLRSTLGNYSTEAPRTSYETKLTLQEWPTISLVFKMRVFWDSEMAYFTHRS